MNRMGLKENPPPRTTTARHRRQAGFMLIEVLVSVAILAVALSALMDSIHSSIMANQYARDRTKAVFLAQTKMWEMEDLLVWKSRVDPYDRTGDFESPNSNYRWEIEVESNEDLSEHVVSVNVFWSHGGRRSGEKRYRLVTAIPMDRGEEFLK